MHEASFDDFYRSTRADLLLQTFLLNGDLRAAAGATRAAYVAGWQHRSKVGELEDPLGWVRPLAFRLAQRRHAARVRHRHTPVSAEQGSVLRGLAALGGSRRRLVVLVHAAGLPLPRAARELALTVPAATRRLAEAEAELTRTWACPVEEIPRRLELLRPVASPTVLPRTPIVLRAGRRRRRLQAATTVAAVVGLTLSAGVVAKRAVPPPSTPGEAAGPAVSTTLADTLLSADSVSALLPTAHWRVQDTSDNTAGDGINTICQQERFADPRGTAALVRTFAARGRQVSAVQTLEVSRSPREAKHAFQEVLGWFGDCQERRVHLVRTYRVGGVGDASYLLVLHAAGAGAPAQTVGIGRAGTSVTTVVARAGSARTVPPAAAMLALARAVRGQCPGGTCVKAPKLSPVRPPRTGEDPGLLSVVDLPPIPTLAFPWVGVASAKAGRRNPAATLCDRTGFGAATRARTRTYLVPEARVPVRFGLAETYGVFPHERQARRFVAGIARRMDTCSDRDVTTTVAATTRTRSRPGTDLIAWAMRTEVSRTETVRFRTGVVRAGAVVAQVTFVPSDRDDLSPAQMRALLERARQRLRELH